MLEIPKCNCMNQHNEEKRKKYIKKLVSNSKAIITHQIAVPLGSQTMGKILYWIDNIVPLNEIDLSVFSRYNDQIRNLPIGAERLSYNKDYLLLEDSKLDHITTDYKKEILEKCFEIIQQYDIKKN